MRKMQHYLHAMRLLEGEDGVEFLVVGGGPRDEEVRGYVDQHGISSFRWLDYAPREQLHRSLHVGDVRLVDVRSDMVVVLLQLGDVPERRREPGPGGVPGALRAGAPLQGPGGAAAGSGGLRRRLRHRPPAPAAGDAARTSLESSSERGHRRPASVAGRRASRTERGAMPRNRRATGGGGVPAGAVCAALAGAMLAVGPGQLAAQSAGADPSVGPQPGGFGFHAAGGVAIPAGELGDVIDAGASLDAGVSYFVNRRLGLWADGDLQFASGAADDFGNVFPDMRLLHAGVGGEVNLFSGYDVRDAPRPDPFITTFRLGLGLSSLDTEDTADGGGAAPVSFEHTYLNVQGGVTAGYQAAPRVAVYVGSKVYLILTDRGDTQALAQLSPEVDVFDTAWSVPLHAGVRITLR